MSRFVNHDFFYGDSFVYLLKQSKRNWKQFMCVNSQQQYQPKVFMLHYIHNQHALSYSIILTPYSTIIFKDDDDGYSSTGIVLSNTSTSRNDDESSYNPATHECHPQPPMHDPDH